MGLANAKTVNPNEPHNEKAISAIRVKYNLNITLSLGSIEIDLVIRETVLLRGYLYKYKYICIAQKCMKIICCASHSSLN